MFAFLLFTKLFKAKILSILVLVDSVLYRDNAIEHEC